MKVYSLFFICLLLPGLNVMQAQDPTRFADFVNSISERDKTSPPPDGVVLFVGSSSIRMWSGMAKAFPHHEVLNRGFGGSQFSDLIYFADQLIFAYKPSRILIYEGDNDISAGKKTGIILRDARKLVKMIQQRLPGVTIAFISPKPSVARWQLKKQYEKTNAKLKALAARKAGVDYIDVWYPSLGEDGKPRPETFIQDNLHMNEKGYAIWEEVIGAYLGAGK